MNTRTILGLVALGLFTSSPLLLASGCSDDAEGDACAEGAYACAGSMLQRCTGGVLVDVEDCGALACEADHGHCGDHHDEHDDHHDEHDDHHDEHDDHHDEHDDHHDD